MLAPLIISKQISLPVLILRSVGADNYLVAVSQPLVYGCPMVVSV